MLSREQDQIHQRAISLSRKHRRLEVEIVEILQNVERTKLFRLLDKPSLFRYAVETLGFSESVTYAFITVSRKATAIPELKEALAQQILSVSKASRIVSSLNSENAGDLIQFAARHTSREIDQEVARRNPKKAKRDRSKPISADQVQVTMTLSQETFEKLQRAQSLRAQRQKS